MDIDNQSRISEVYGGTISLIVLATVLVVARLFARRVSVAKLWWDDYTIIAALVSMGLLIYLVLQALQHPCHVFGRVSMLRSSESP